MDTLIIDSNPNKNDFVEMSVTPTHGRIAGREVVGGVRRSFRIPLKAHANKREMLRNVSTGGLSGIRQTTCYVLSALFIQKLFLGSAVCAGAAKKFSAAAPRRQVGKQQSFGISDTCSDDGDPELDLFGSGEGGGDWDQDREGNGHVALHVVPAPTHLSLSLSPSPSILHPPPPFFLPRCPPFESPGEQGDSGVTVQPGISHHLQHRNLSPITAARRPESRSFVDADLFADREISTPG
jgi:hypothetical protein